VEQSKTRSKDSETGLITEKERTTFDNGEYRETVRVKEDGFITRTVSTTVTKGKNK
jgi:hypothetical protein